MNNDADINATDALIVGVGAAGLATAIFAARRLPNASITALDGANKIGAKILVSGGGRCNVTNVKITPSDFWGGRPNTIKQILSALPVEQTIDFFKEIGVALHEEEYGKLFPDTHKAKTVLDAMLQEAQRLNVNILTGQRVNRIEREAEHFTVFTEANVQYQARCIVLSTGGRSLPKTGSDGAGYALAQSLGHSLVPTTPGLAPLLLDGDFHTPLSGISQDVELTIAAEGRKPTKMVGPMLWTHWGISGPVAMDASRHWHRAALEGAHPKIILNLMPGEDFASCEKMLLDGTTSHPKAQVQKFLSGRVPTRVAAALLKSIGVAEEVTLAHLSREERRKIVHSLLAWPLPVRDSRGYVYAEVTAGGVGLDEIESSSMASRKCPGLFLVGEILDVDGRIGGFNFQWAWSGGYVAARGIERFLSTKVLR